MTWIRPLRRLVLSSAILLVLPAFVRADAPATIGDAPPAANAPVVAPPPAPQPVDYTEETLDNGLHVVYSPLHQAPVVHVRVLYHVGSRDERPDRQGFAHMFEHMMFRGSAHVKPEEHMKRIGVVGGYSNAFTSFDKTVYVDTIPSEHLEMALYLEADRMASFKVSEGIFKTEREVVAKEWGMKENRPYGNLYDQFLKTAFTTHSYRWTPIGNMEQLRNSRVEELQDFFNTYYLPNNAVLVIAGDIDLPATKAMVHKYFGWIPKGPTPPRLAEPEPPQTEPRRATDPEAVPLPAVVIGWHIPPYRDNDQYALSVLGSILADGESSRLKRLLVNNKKPTCQDAYSISEPLEDGGIWGVGGIVLPGANPDHVEQLLSDAVGDIRDHGVSEAELAKAKTQIRDAEIRSRATCTEIADQLGEETLIGGDAARVNAEPGKIDAITAADVQAVAVKYCQPNAATTLRVKPDLLAAQKRAAASTQVSAVSKAGVLPATRPVETRNVQFPPNYPTTAPMAAPKNGAEFAKGTESTIDGVRVIVMPDHRLPTVNWALTLRRGGQEDPAGKEGLTSLTTDMLTRGAADLTYDQLSEDLDSRGISLSATDLADNIRIGGSCTVNQLDHAMLRTRQVLLQPTFPQDAFDKLKGQVLAGLMQDQDAPQSVAGHELAAALYGPKTVLGRHTTPASVNAITIDDIKNTYKSLFSPQGAILVFAGDITVERGQALARQLLDGFAEKDLPAAPDYTLPPAPKRRIILVDRPASMVQSVIRMGVRAYDIHTDEKFAGSVAGQILTAGIDSRLGKYVRAQKGLAYAVSGVFQPGRHAGAFTAGTDTDLRLTGDAIEAMIKVFDDMRAANVTPTELAEAKTRVAGSMVMGMQTIQQQAAYRTDGILNDYPIDYYDKYPQRINEVTADQVRAVMEKYVPTGDFVIVVVAPADKVKPQLERFGTVEVLPMPALREGATTQPSDAGEMLKPAK